MDHSQTEAFLWSAALTAYVALIFYLSSRPHLQPPVTFPLWDKAAHFVEYGILGGLAGLAAGRRVPVASRRPSPVLILAVALFGLTVALLDETLQRRVPGREASLADFAADAVGILAGLAAAQLASRAWVRRTAARDRNRKSRKAGS
ncbi:MAG: VanZ family protein [Candidatus Eisenbacteria bacterium]